MRGADCKALREKKSSKKWRLPHAWVRGNGVEIVCLRNSSSSGDSGSVGVHIRSKKLKESVEISIQMILLPFHSNGGLLEKSIHLFIFFVLAIVIFIF